MVWNYVYHIWNSSSPKNIMFRLRITPIGRWLSRKFILCCKNHYYPQKLMMMIGQAQLIQTADSCQERSAPKCAGAVWAAFEQQPNNRAGFQFGILNPGSPRSLSCTCRWPPVSARYLEKQYTPAKFSHNTFRQLQYFMPHKLDFAS